MAHSASSIRLIVNADGFGLSAARNRGVLAAHRDGIVTSTSVLGNAADPAAVLADLAAVPTLGTGVWVALTGGAPVAAAGSISSLVEPDGRLPARARDFLRLWAKGALRDEAIERELDAQVARWREAGLRIDHLASKDHLGSLPQVAMAMERTARRHGIAGLRIVIERPSLAWVTDLPRGLATAGLGALAWWSRRHLGALRHGPETWGSFETGRLDPIRLLEFLGRLGPGSHELLCAPDHPEAAEALPRQDEVAALCAPEVRAAIERRTIELCRWSDLF